LHADFPQYIIPLMWSRIETNQGHNRNSFFLELGRTRDALTIYRSRKIFASQQSNDYDDTRDRNALQQGLDRLKTPKDPGQRYKHNVLLGNVVDWSRKPADVSPDAYVALVARTAASTIEAVLADSDVDAEELTATERLFGRWTGFAKLGTWDNKSPDEKHAAYLLEELRSTRITIDVIDKTIIKQAGQRTFEVVLADVLTLLGEDEEAKEIVDPELRSVIRERSKIAVKVAEIKHGLGTGTTDRLREMQMMELRYNWGEEAGLNRIEIKALIKPLMEASKDIQESTRQKLLDEKSELML
jgi:chorismate mutase